MKSSIIYNPNNELSVRLMNDSIASCKLFGIIPDPFVGTFGDNIDPKLAKYNLIPSEYKSNPTNGEKGCFISHYELWIKCVNDNEPYLILEHDVTMKSKLPADILEGFSDILNLDYCGSLRKDQDSYLKCMAVVGSGEIVDIFTDINLPKPSWKNFKTYHVVGAHAYIIKPSGASKLIEVSELAGFLPVDVHINSYYVDISIIKPAPFRTCDFMIDRKNRVKYSSTKRS